MINLLAVENSAHPKSEYFEKKVPDIDCKKFLRVKNIFAIESFFILFLKPEKKNTETEQTWGSRLECLNISTSWMKIAQDS